MCFQVGWGRKGWNSIVQNELPLAPFSLGLCEIVFIRSEEIHESADWALVMPHTTELLLTTYMTFSWSSSSRVFFLRSLYPLFHHYISTGFVVTRIFCVRKLFSQENVHKRWTSELTFPPHWIWRRYPAFHSLTVSVRIHVSLLRIQSSMFDPGLCTICHTASIVQFLLSDSTVF